MSEKSHIVTDALLQYAKTKKDKVKYEEGHEQEAEEKIRKLDEKHWNDFEGKGDTIKDAACAKADALDAKRRAELTASKPKLKAQYRLERFNKTAEDKDESGNPYNPVKTTIAKEIEDLQKKDSDNNEDDKDKQAEEEQNAKDEAQDKEEEAQTEKQKKNTKEKHKKKSKETKQKKLMKTQNSPQQIAKVIGKMKDAEVDEEQPEQYPVQPRTLRLHPEGHQIAYQRNHIGMCLRTVAEQNDITHHHSERLHLETEIAPAPIMPEEQHGYYSQY